jgi:hypothetical protein
MMPKIECLECEGTGLVECDCCGTAEAQECDECGGSGEVEE